MKNLDRRLIIIFIIQVTEVLGFSLILPFLPFYAQSYGATPFTVGLILTVFSLFQFISSPIMGKLSDTYGRRPLLLISQFSTFISFLVLGFSNTLFLIFLSRAIDGLLGSNFTIAQAYISDVTSKKDRSKAFGLSGAAFGFGFLIGPAIGGYLSRFGFAVPAFLAAAISAITILLTYFFLPETVPNKKRGGFSIKEIEIFSLKPFKKYLTNKKISPHLWQLFFYLLAHATWTTSYPLYGSLKMGLNAETTGFLLAYIGLISIILRMKVIPKLVDIFEEPKLILWGMIFVTVGLFIAPFFNSIPPFMIAITIYSFGTGITRPLLNGAVSKSVDEKEQGAIMGVVSSLGSFSQIVGPMIGGLLLTHSYPESLLFTSTGIMAIGLIIFLKQSAKSR